MNRLRRGLAVLLLAPLCLSFVAIPATKAQIEPAVRDRVVSVAVQVAIPVIWTENNIEFEFPIPVGSGTIISPSGLVLTNQHVIDNEVRDQIIADSEAAVQADYPDATFHEARPGYTLLASDGMQPSSPLYRAMLEVADAELDIAILRITEYADEARRGMPVDSTPFIQLLKAPDQVGLSDAVHVFSFPGIGSGSLTYTTGVVSGFSFNAESDELQWILTDAVMSGGSSGGTAVDDAGRLIGIATAGSQLDCRPGDTNQDGVVDASDVGCIPIGGSLGRLIPMNLVIDLLEESDLERAAMDQANTDASSTLPLPIPGPTVTIGSGASTAPRSPGSEFGLAEDFLVAPSWTPVDDDTHSVEVTGHVMVLTIKEPGGLSTFHFSNHGTSGQDAGVRVDIAQTSGWGEAILAVQTEDGAEWHFTVNPYDATWSLYRSSVDTGQFFHWVEPINYSTRVRTHLRNLEVRVRDGQPSFHINGVNIVSATNLPMPEMDGDLIFGFGAGINPNLPSPSEGGFTVLYDKVSLFELE